MSTDELFLDFPDDSRVWIFPLKSVVSSQEQLKLLKRLQTFCEQWTSHGKSVRGTVDILFSNFVVVVASDEKEMVSGCGIDSMVRAVREEVQSAGLSVADYSQIYAEPSPGSIQSFSPEEFKAAVESHSIRPETPVFDNAIQSLGELRSDQWKKPFLKSWHSQRYPLPVC